MVLLQQTVCRRMCSWVWAKRAHAFSKLIIASSYFVWHYRIAITALQRMVQLSSRLNQRG